MFKDSKYQEYLTGLTDGQNVAFHKIVKWFDEYYNTTTRTRANIQTFVLSGYAGTGKSFLMGVLDKYLTDRYQSNKTIAATAYTGKASTILAEKGMNASTIHKLLYIPAKYEFVDSETKEVRTRVKWVRKQSLEDEVKLIIVDECSMMPDKLYQDLRSLNLPILCVGDGFQLPSIDQGTNLLDNPDYTLTEITRQALDNSIIRLSMLIREGGDIPYGDFGDHVTVVGKRDLNIDDYVEIIDVYDQFLVGTNKSRLYFNTLYRRHLLGEHYDNNPLPCEKEKIIITQNNWDFNIDRDGNYQLFNGLVGTVSAVEPSNMNQLDKLKLKINFGKKVYNTDWIVYDTGIFRESLNNMLRFTHFENDQLVHEDIDGNYFVKLDKNQFDKLPPEEQSRYVRAIYNSPSILNINHLDFAYAISVHKFQGSEADRVAVLDESYVFGRDDEENGRRWLYTAVTRAKKYLLLIK